jgi:hypothetical protein
MLGRQKLLSKYLGDVYFFFLSLFVKVKHLKIKSVYSPHGDALNSEMKHIKGIGKANEFSFNKSI